MCHKTYYTYRSISKRYVINQIIWLELKAEVVEDQKKKNKKL